MIHFKSNGDFKKVTEYLKKLPEYDRRINLEKYGQMGVDALSSATPRDTGLTASSWYYEITYGKTRTTINFCNSNIQNGVPIAVILQYGHVGKDGGFVSGIDYINPSLRGVFQEIAESAWAEVNK